MSRASVPGPRRHRQPQGYYASPGLGRSGGPKRRRPRLNDTADAAPLEITDPLGDPAPVFSVTREDLPSPPLPTLAALATMGVPDSPAWLMAIKAQAAMITKLVDSRQVGMNLALIGNAEAQITRLSSLGTVVAALEAKVFSPDVMANLTIGQLISLYTAAVGNYTDGARLLLSLKQGTDFKAVKDAMETLIREAGAEVPGAQAALAGPPPADAAAAPGQVPAPVPGHLASQMVYLLQQNKTVH